jgi:4-amino-4-deoxy-L-arabinose transferase-like glycosyltransferase
MSSRRTVALLFAATAIVRAAYVLAAHPGFQYEHWDMATNLLRYHSLGFDGVPTTRYEPLYPLFVAAARAIVGDRALIIQLIQVAIGSIAVIYLWRLVDALTGSRRIALIAALLFALYPLSIRHAADGTETSLLAAFLVIFCFAFVAARTTRDAVIAGAWLGLAVVTRTMTLPLVALASIVWLIDRRPGHAAALATTALLVYAPYAIRNEMLNGSVVPTRTGIDLFISNSASTPAIVPEHHANALEPLAESVVAREGLSADVLSPPIERRRNDVLLHAALTEIRAHPAEMLQLRLRYLGYFFSPFLVPRQEKSAGGDVPRPLIDRVVYTLTFTPVLACAVVGAYHRRHAIQTDAILWCVLLTFVAAHLVFFPATRYRVPADFVLLFFAAAAIGLFLEPHAAGARPLR